MMCMNMMANRAARFKLRETFNFGGSSYDGVFSLCIANDCCCCISLGSYRALDELVLKHVLVIWLVRGTTLLCHSIDLRSGEEILL